MVVKTLILGCKVRGGRDGPWGQGPDSWLSACCSLLVHQPFDQSPVFQNGDERDIKKAWACASENSHSAGEIKSRPVLTGRVPA